jgi:hypothetical protein
MKMNATTATQFWKHPSAFRLSLDVYPARRDKKRSFGISICLEQIHVNWFRLFQVT